MINVLRWEQHGDMMAVFAVQNPVTRNMIDLKPPIEIGSNEDAQRFADWIKGYCTESWKVRLDPKVVDASDWRGGEPAIV